MPEPRIRCSDGVHNSYRVLLAPAPLLTAPSSTSNGVVSTVGTAYPQRFGSP
jgi:hypothetical protein